MIWIIGGIIAYPAIKNGMIEDNMKFPSIPNWSQYDKKIAIFLSIFGGPFIVGINLFCLMIKPPNEPGPWARHNYGDEKNPEGWDTWLRCSDEQKQGMLQSENIEVRVSARKLQEYELKKYTLN